jgi:hypothetical protein
MPSKKSPGLNGFSWEFYLHCWPVVKTDVLDVLNALWIGTEQGFQKKRLWPLCFLRNMGPPI